MSDEEILLGEAKIDGLFYLFRESSWSPRSKHSIFGHEIHIVTCPEYCKWILDKMLEEIPNYIGFNCEWNQGQPVTLKLADPHRFCVLIRLQEMSSIPDTLQFILSSKEIVKAGVDAVQKANILNIKGQCIEACSILDIRHLYNTKPNDLWNIVINELEIVQEQNEEYMTNDIEDQIDYEASEVIACAKLLARYSESYQKVGPVQLYFNKHYYSSYHTEVGYEFHHVTTTEHCAWIVSKLEEEISKEANQTKCIGFECTWFEDESGRRPVQLLQIAGPKRICAIIRLKLLDHIPEELHRLLLNKSIYKAGVSSIQGSKLLEKDFGLSVLSLIDLRHLYPSKPNGIVALSGKVLCTGITNWKHGKDRFNPAYATRFQLTSSGLEAIAAVKLFYEHLNNIVLPLGLADALEEYINKEYVESTSPYTQHKIFNNDIHVVSSPEHCRWVVSKLREDMGKYRHIGFDFQNDILHLASRDGICALIQLNIINDIPWELRELLKTKSIIKCTEYETQKAKSLEESYFLQVNSVRHPLCLDPSTQNLVDVAKRELCVDLSETICIRNTIELTHEEIQYCAGKVIAYAKMALGHFFIQNLEITSASISNTCLDTTHKVFGHTIYIVNTSESCRFVTKKLREVTQDYPFVGFDCERLPLNPRGPVTLLQLAGGKGSQRLCALIKLYDDFEIPQELCDLLNDRTIAKAGVEPVQDAQYLQEDYDLDVQATIDLRFLYPPSSYQQANGLAALAYRELNVYLNKDKKLTMSGFHQSILSYEQIQYAAGDAIAGANLFEKYWQKCNKSMDRIQPFFNESYSCSKRHLQSIPVAQSQFTNPSELESPAVRTVENPGAVNVQQPSVGSCTNRKSKRCLRNKKKYQSHHSYEKF